MDNPSLRHNRAGITVASALGLVTASYFELELRDVVPNLFAGLSQPLADVFSERVQVHATFIAEPAARALAFAVALAATLTMIHGDAGRSWCLRITYEIGTLVLPIIALVLTVVAQPLALGELCAPCLLQSLFSLAILESRRDPYRPPVTNSVGARPLEDEAWHRVVSSPSVGVRRLGRDDAHR
jgi:hypothetical protein